LKSLCIGIKTPDPPSPLKKGEPEFGSKSPFLRLLRTHKSNQTQSDPNREVLADSLDDPDIGLKLRPEIEQQLLAAQSRRAAGQRAGTSAAGQMKSFYEPGNELAQWTDEDPEDFQDYQSYA
jgi:hypothetical protein